jgi:uroporphyrinogen-III synthase
MGDAGPLAGRRVLVTRERPGELGARLEQRGALVVHVPLIAIEDPPDGGAALVAALDHLEDHEWLVVTSAAGAERVGTAAAACPSVRLAAVGTATARTLADISGRSVDVVPAVQRATALAEELIRVAGPSPQRFLIAHADRSADTLEASLRSAGHLVTTVIAYRTALCAPDRAALTGADALVLASGSAAQGWFEAVGTATPPIVVAIGPVTADVARGLGLKVTGVAADHSLDGLMTELERQFRDGADADR